MAPPSTTIPLAPTIIVIFGITGDLSRTKLLPALVDLENEGLLPKRLKIIGFSRRDFAKGAFPEFVREALNARGHSHAPEVIDRFCARLAYCPALFDNSKGYAKLGEQILDLEKNEFKQCTNKLYYLAVSPDFYETIFRELADSGLTIPCGGEDGWSRILVEKPFGKDIKTAQELDDLLGKLFKEEQVFRIDHYLAKEAVQNILMFRFSNTLFEPLWEHEHIDRVEIRQLETNDVSDRGSFYDGVGALRDVGQNHMLQMLSLIAMERPVSLSATDIRPKRADVFDSLRLIETDDIREPLRGQYQGYTEEKGVAAGSKTETYFTLAVEVRNKRWKGVPFILESGKALSESKAEIVIYFKGATVCLACGTDPCEHRNTLTFRIQPDEGITLRFWIKKPGLGKELEEKTLSFSYAESSNAERLPDAYERLLFDALSGDQTLFTSTDEVEATWKFITPILEEWKDTAPHTYEKGSERPDIKST